jgi:hypothetical protein
MKRIIYLVFFFNEDPYDGPIAVCPNDEDGVIDDKVESMSPMQMFCIIFILLIFVSFFVVGFVFIFGFFGDSGDNGDGYDDGCDAFDGNYDAFNCFSDFFAKNTCDRKLTKKKSTNIA